MMITNRLTNKRGTFSATSNKGILSKFKYGNEFVIIFSLIIVIFLLIPFVFIYNIGNNDVATVVDLPNKNKNTVVSVRRETVDDIFLRNENLFLKTIKSCNNNESNGGKKCKERKVQGLNSIGKVTRVGIMAPPSDIADSFFDLIKEAVDTNLSPNNEKILLERETHVPPYGYGGNHGWSKVVRLLLPLKLSLTDTCDKNNVIPSLGVLKQIIRWHCRLSHFSAHTPLLTVNIKDLLIDGNDPINIIKTILSFINPNQETNNNHILDFVQSELFDLRESISIAKNDLHELSSLTLDLESALDEELKNTNQLSDWPCTSFLSLGEEENNHQLVNLAQSLAPDCQSSYVKCTIPIDLCEHEGQFPCSK